ncbi:MAG: aminoacyl-tRNA hydrolase [Myxococcales bacterium]|nr:aminoacyl-tRNA hydrolase [Myxococcales bacterium]MCB9648844.1 aminoacyl-tRNA hydrolase [Deltaproteobacteria bacterium]
MFIVVGLGNPGREYEDTRHNVGFMVVDALAERAGVQVCDKKFKARVGRARLEGEDCLLMKPETFMNLSGESVGPALGFFKLSTAQVIVVHDELDLPLGTVRLKKGGGHGGHNGLRSLKQHLPDDGFVRVRIGIGKPPPQWDTADYVLSRFASSERAVADSALNEAASAVRAVLKDGIGKAMGHFNRDPEKERAKAERRRKKIEGGADSPAQGNESKATEGES